MFINFYKFSFDQTIADKVTLLANKLVKEEIIGVDPIFSELNSNQIRELLSQLLDQVYKLNNLNQLI